MTYYSVINNIKTALDAAGVPCTLHAIYNGYQLHFPWCKGDIACHAGTYGAKHSNVESYCFPWDDFDVTELTPTEAIVRIIKYYNYLKGE